MVCNSAFWICSSCSVRKRSLQCRGDDPAYCRLDWQIPRNYNRQALASLTERIVGGLIFSTCKQYLESEYNRGHQQKSWPTPHLFGLMISWTNCQGRRELGGSNTLQWHQARLLLACLVFWAPQVFHFKGLTTPNRVHQGRYCAKQNERLWTAREMPSVQKKPTSGACQAILECWSIGRIVNLVGNFCCIRYAELFLDIHFCRFTLRTFCLADLWPWARHVPTGPAHPTVAAGCPALQKP